MAAKTIERNYRKNPHTANFLMTFHAAAAGLPSDLDGENDYLTPGERDLARAEDLLDLVPAEAPAYLPTKRQQDFISDLIREITELNKGAGALAFDYTAQRTRTGTWTPERVSQWIERLIVKRAELRKVAVQPGWITSVKDGRYAIEEDGVLKFFRVKKGRNPGFVFLDIQASDDWHAIRDLARIRRVIAEIAKDPKGAMLRYGRELGECGHCGRTLTDEASRAAGIGPVCASK